MSILSTLRSLDRPERNTVLASFLGWSLDAFDFFILVFVIKDVAAGFGARIETVTIAILLTLAMRPVGALLFGLAADRYGRRPTLMANVLLYSALGFASGFAPSLTALLALRALFGIAMGGEWGIGASLVMETIPPRSRGVVSGVLQAGYPTGYLLAAIAYAVFYSVIGWRGMFMLGCLPALLVFFIRRNVAESPAFNELDPASRRFGFFRALRKHGWLFAYAVVFMTAFNVFSHGTQDLYPTFLQVQDGLSSHAVGIIGVIYNVGAIIGGLTFGALSERSGRRHAIISAALLALPIIPLWAFATNPLWLAAGAFLMQFAVQGAWGVIPAYLNELSPGEARGTFPGLAYQLGNLFASGSATIQAWIAQRHGGDFSYAQAVVAGLVACVIIGLTLAGREARGVQLVRRGSDPQSDASGAPGVM
jgi:SHS family lactate transporter-like MFS transporter